MDTETSSAGVILPGAGPAGGHAPAPVLMLHEPGTDSAVWGAALVELKGERSIVIAPADADAATLIELLRARSSASFHVVGLGAAGGLATRLACEHRDLVRSVVAIDGEPGDTGTPTPVSCPALVVTGTAHLESAAALASAAGAELLRLPGLVDAVRNSSPGYLAGLLEAYWTGLERGPAARRALVIYTASSPDVSTLTTRWESLIDGRPTEGPVSLRMLETTRGYAADSNRRQSFYETLVAVQLDYRLEDEPVVLELLDLLDLPDDAGSRPTIAVGHVVVCLPPAGRHVLLLGAQRHRGLTADDFRLYWSLAHAPYGSRWLRSSAAQLGYELFLVDREVTDAQDAARWRPDWVDGWMQITSAGAEDFAVVGRDPERRAWVLDDERHFVDFNAPMIGQQMYTQSIITTH